MKRCASFNDIADVKQFVVASPNLLEMGFSDGCVRASVSLWPYLDHGSSSDLKMAACREFVWTVLLCKPMSVHT